MVHTSTVTARLERLQIQHRDSTVVSSSLVFIFLGPKNEQNPVHYPPKELGTNVRSSREILARGGKEHPSSLINLAGLPLVKSKQKVPVSFKKKRLKEIFNRARDARRSVAFRKHLSASLSEA